jgi:membrane protein involved in colicin uptake
VTKHRDRSTRIAALRQMTVERGCSPEEAKTAKRILDELLAEDAPRRTREDGYDEVIIDLGGDRAKRAARAAATYTETARKRAEAAAAKEWAEFNAKKKAKADYEAKKQAEAEALRRRAAEAMEEANRRQRDAAARKQAIEEAAAKVSEDILRRRMAAEEASVKATGRRVSTRAAEAAYRDSQFSALEKSPFRMRRALEGGSDTCPSCGAAEGLEAQDTPGATGPTSFGYRCTYCDDTFKPYQSQGIWVYRKVAPAGRQHRYW